MPTLRWLSILCTGFTAIEPMMIWGFEKTIEYIDIGSFEQHVSVQDLFAAGRYELLWSFSIVDNKQTRTLAPENFTNLPINKLDVSAMDIDVILDGTFDVLADTLRFLHLCALQLLTIKPEQFYALLLNTREFNKAYLQLKGFVTEITFFIHESPIECNCDYFWFKYLVLSNIGIVRGLQSVQCEMDEFPEPDVETLATCDLEAIHLNKLCLHSRDLRFVAYAKLQIDLQIKRNYTFVRIRKAMAGPYRIMFITQTAESTGDGPHFTVSCLLVKKNTQDLWIPFVQNRSNIMFVCVQFVTSKRIWPLHLVTARHLEEPAVPADSIIPCYVTLWVIESLISFVAGLAIAVFFKRKPIENPDDPVFEEPYASYVAPLNSSHSEQTYVLLLLLLLFFAPQNRL